MAQIETEPTFSRRTSGPLLSISSYPMTGGRQYDVAPDGDRFIFRKPDAVGQTGDDPPFNGLIVVENWHEDLNRLVPVN